MNPAAERRHLSGQNKKGKSRQPYFLTQMSNNFDVLLNSGKKISMISHGLLRALH